MRAAVPVLGPGLATQAFTARTALLGFSTVLAAVIGLVAGACWRTAQPST